MNKKIVVLTAVFALTAGYVLAEDMNAVSDEPTAAAVETAAPVEVANTICPLTGRTLNLNDANDYTKLEVEGMVFNVCPTAKAAYDTDASQFADKVAKAVADAKAASAAPAVEEAPAEGAIAN